MIRVPEAIRILEGNSVTVRYDHFVAVDALSFHLNEGEWLMLAGPNGAGKSTLIEAIAQGVPCTGSIRWKGRDLKTLKASELAQRIGVLSQKNHVGYAYTVEEVVGLGRYAWKAGLFSGRDDQGKAEVEKALNAAGIEVADTVAHIGETAVRVLKKAGLYDKCYDCHCWDDK